MGKLTKELKMGIHNRFDIEVVDVETGEIKQKAQAFNVVCNNYFTNILNKNQASYIQIGSGSGTPAAGDTSLFHYEGYARDTSSYSVYDTINSTDEADGIWYRQIKRVIPNTVYTGITITEVAFSTSETTGNIVTHAMLQDMNGNPISITHTSTDVIYIYCTIYLHYENQDSDFHIYNNPVILYSNPYGGWVYRALLKSDASGAYMNIEPVTSGGNVIGFVSETTSAANKSFTIKINQVAIGQFNRNGIELLSFHIYWNSNFTNYSGVRAIIECGGSTIPPYRVTSESVGVGDGTTQRFSTKFHKPYNATVYVNGVAVTSGVTVSKLPCTSFAHNSGSGALSRRWMRFVSPDKPTFPIPITAANQSLQAGTYELLIPEIGLYNIRATNGTVKASNDGETWVDVTTNTSSGSMIDQNYAHYKYYRIGSVYSYDTVNCFFNDYDGCNIVFDTPPAQGDVITIDYTTDFIPKDADHVLDVELTVSFGEWQGN